MRSAPLVCFENRKNSSPIIDQTTKLIKIVLMFISDFEAHGRNKALVRNIITPKKVALRRRLFFVVSLSMKSKCRKKS